MLVQVREFQQGCRLCRRGLCLPRHLRMRNTRVLYSNIPCFLLQALSITSKPTSLIAGIDAFSLIMTRRELGRPADDVEGQERDPDVSDGFSQRSSTLPSYEDAVIGTPASEDLKSNSNSNSDEKKVSQCRSSFIIANDVPHRLIASGKGSQVTTCRSC